MPRKYTRAQLRLGLIAVLVLASGVAALNSALAERGRPDVAPTDLFPLLAQTPTASDSLGTAGLDLRKEQAQLPFDLALSGARLAWSGRGYADEARRIYLIPSVDRRWACITLVGDRYRGGASCSETASMFRRTPYQFSIQSDGGSEIASRIEFIGAVSAEVAEVVVTDTRGVAQAITPVNGTFYYAPSRAEIAQGVGLAAVTFNDSSGHELASRELPPF